MEYLCKNWICYNVPECVHGQLYLRMFIPEYVYRFGVHPSDEVCVCVVILGEHIRVVYGQWKLSVDCNPPTKIWKDVDEDRRYSLQAVSVAGLTDWPVDPVLQITCIESILPVCYLKMSLLELG